MEAKKPESQIGAGAANKKLGSMVVHSRDLWLGAIIAGFVLDKLPQIIEEVERIKLQLREPLTLSKTCGTLL